MKFFAALVFALFFICAVHAQKGPVHNDEEDCPSACAYFAEPTCGYDGHCYRQFGNSCVLKVAACQGEGNFKKVDMEDCLKPGVKTC